MTECLREQQAHQKGLVPSFSKGANPWMRLLPQVVNLNFSLCCALRRPESGCAADERAPFSASTRGTAGISLCCPVTFLRIQALCLGSQACLLTKQAVSGPLLASATRIKVISPRSIQLALESNLLLPWHSPPSTNLWFCT